ncbi:MAG: four helix bundle protein [Bacteroidetes bacterium]|jgi:four helix bundle protein|nr:four helix bundle protein [Bacteroidota bacterium]
MLSSNYKQDNLILNLTFDFSLVIIDFSEKLNEMHKFVLSNQILRSGTSIGANVKEAQNAESKSDFIHKFKIAAKEADEAEYWLLLAQHSKYYPETTTLLNQLTEIQKIINKIISTTKRNYLKSLFSFLF